MTALYIIIGIALFILDIVILVKFFQLCANVKRLTEKLCKPEKPTAIDITENVDITGELRVGDKVQRLSDGAEMYVERMGNHSYACRRVADNEWMGVYKRDKIAKIQ